MIIIDTNIISKMTHPEPYRQDLAWSDAVGHLHTAVRRYENVVGDRERTGQPIASADAQIAAICANWGATLTPAIPTTSSAQAFA